jgi:hypothetical protein
MSAVGGKQMEALAASVQQRQQAANGFYGAIEANLALAKYAEVWEWKEIGTQTKEEAAN